MSSDLKSYFLESVISTPVGDYNPDWAVVTDALGKRHVYFVAETKGSLGSLDLRGIEDAKIACARKHFAAISGTNITYDVVRTYHEPNGDCPRS